MRHLWFPPCLWFLEQTVFSSAMTMQIVTRDLGKCSAEGEHLLLSAMLNGANYPPWACLDVGKSGCKTNQIVVQFSMLDKSPNPQERYRRTFLS